MNSPLFDPPAQPRGSFAFWGRCAIFVACVWAVSEATRVRGGYEPPNPAYEPPVGYYSAATGTGSTLRMNLHNVISADYHGISYGDARYALAITDQDPNNPNNILLVYNRASVPGVWDVGVTWNREHLWPQSKLGVKVTNTYIGPASDLFELKPCNPSINSGRSNDAYGTPTSTGGYLNTSGYFFPGDADKGDVARSMFYMATRYYNGSGTASIQNLSLVNGYTIATYQMGDLQSLLHWNYTDGVDNFERRRNQMIYSNTVTPAYSQNNRNPFIDHPEYVWAVYGDHLEFSQAAQANVIVNDSQISVAPPDAGGASTANVNLGRIMKNGAFGSQAIAVTKIGADPTTFNISTSGNAATVASGSALVAGAGQPMDYGTQTRTIVAGLDASTATTGLKSGSITIDNTDLTSSLTLSGRGSADGDDTINIFGSVLDNRIVTAGEVDLGAVHLGAAKSGLTSLATTGDDNHFTRVTVAGQLFNGAASTGTAGISPTLSTAGPASGTVTLTTTGEGLANESPVNVPVRYTAQVFTGKMAWNAAVGSVNWQTDANWTDTQSAATAGAPGLSGSFSLGDTATFSGGASPVTVSLLNASPHVAAIAFSGPNPFTIAQGAGTGTLHLDNGGSMASISAMSGGHQITAPLIFDSSAAIDVIHGGDTLTFGADVTAGGAFTKNGEGTLEVSGPAHFGQGTSITVGGGMLRLAAPAGSSVASDVVAHVAAGATLELAGPVSALVNEQGGSNRPQIKNDGTFSITTSGNAVAVAGIDGDDMDTGVTSVSAGATLAADHIIQAALTIGGDPDFAGLVEIAASDEIGNPLSAASPAASLSFSRYGISPGIAATVFNSAADFPLGVVPAGSPLIPADMAVPEPASPVLLFIGALGVVAAGIRRRSIS